MRRLTTILGAILASGLAVTAQAAEKDLTDKGEVLVRQKCGQCHAVGAEGESPNKEAPPFRTLSSKYPIENLAEALAEGIVSGHPEMPIFVFNPHEVDAILAYLESIQAPEAPDGAPTEAPGEMPDG
jgi:cytochrome c